MLLRSLLEFSGIAVLLTLAPGPGLAVVVRSSLRGGQAAAFRTIVGNEIGLCVWAVLSAFGVSALVTASEVAFGIFKLVGAAVLVMLGLQALLSTRRGGARRPSESRVGVMAHQPLMNGLLTALANPKLAIFFAALFPQFVPRGVPVLPATLVEAGLVVVFDFAWFLVVAFVVARAGRLLRGVFSKWLERLSGVVLIGLGASLVLERY